MKPTPDQLRQGSANLRKAASLSSNKAEQQEMLNKDGIGARGDCFRESLRTVSRYEEVSARRREVMGEAFLHSELHRVDKSDRKCGAFRRVSRPWCIRQAELLCLRVPLA